MISRTLLFLLIAPIARTVVAFEPSALSRSRAVIKHNDVFIARSTVVARPEVDRHINSMDVTEISPSNDASFALQKSSASLPYPTRTDLASSVAESIALPNSDPSTLLQGQTAVKRHGVKTWVTRLNTKEDTLSFHKISSFIFMLSSTVIMGAGAISGFQEVPAWLQPFDSAYFASTMLCCLFSVPMAMTHRRAQPKVRNQFINMALVTGYMTLLAEWFSPFCPDLLCNKMVSDVGFTGFIGVLVLLTIDGFMHSNELVDCRIRKKDLATADTSGTKQVMFIMSFSGMVMNVIFLANMWDPTHDRQWFLNMANDFAGVAPFYYNSILTTLVVMYGALIVTLRDKKLVSKEFEDMWLYLGTGVWLASTVGLFVPIP